MIFVTGDIHGDISVKRLSSKNFKLGSTLTANDYLIILGDFGLIWNRSKSGQYWLDWLSNKPWVTLFCDGNHENHQLLSEYPITMWQGGKTHMIRENVIHLMRGQIFDLEGTKIFSMGGAYSDDQDYRTEGLSWWPEEMPSKEEYEEGMSNLEKHDFKVDFIISHTTPTLNIPMLNNYRVFPRFPNELTQFLEVVRKHTDYIAWYHGHYHVDLAGEHNVNAVYRKILRIDSKKDQLADNKSIPKEVDE